VPISAAGSAGVPTSVTKPTLGVAPRSVATVAVVSIVGLLAVGLLASGLLFRGGAVVAPSGSPASAPSNAIAGGGTTKGTIDIALELMPSKSPISVGIANGVKLALAEAGGAAGGWKVELPASAILDDGGDAEHGKANMQAIAGQPSVMAVIGPQQSGIASGQIPISNAAGLLQCSPSAASDSLTKPDAGALKLRSSQPTRINFVRTVATNSSDAPGTAKFILENLRRSNVYVVDNTVSTAKQRAELFSAYFSQHGGTVVGRGAIPKTATDLTDLVADVTAKRPDVLFFSGSANSSEIVARFFKATRKDFGAVPFVASGEIKADSKFTDLAGADLGTNVFASLAAADDFPGKADFTMRYQAAFGVAPGTYSATAHVCATVILDAIKRAGDPKDLADLRERIRAAAVDPSVTHPSVIGDFRFDENGDPDPQIITIYRYDPRNDRWGVEGFIHSDG
jgi:branched-chain amino acid transport system substrate-binding protein